SDLASRLALRLGLPLPGLCFRRVDDRGNLRKPFGRKYLDRADLLLGEVPSQEISRLHLDPRMTAIPFHGRTRLAELTTRAIPVPPVQDLPAVHENWHLHAVLPNVLAQRRIIARGQ